MFCSPTCTQQPAVRAVLTLGPCLALAQTTHWVLQPLHAVAVLEQTAAVHCFPSWQSMPYQVNALLTPGASGSPLKLCCRLCRRAGI